MSEEEFAEQFTAKKSALTDIAAEIEDADVADHVRAYGTTGGPTGLWLPAVWSERDDALRARIVAELGSPVASGYMSEECGWALG